MFKKRMKNRFMDSCALYLSCIFILITFVMLFGCISEKQFLPSEKEVLERSFGNDLNNDGLFEQYFGFFKPKTVGNITVKREIFSNRKIGNEVTTTLRIISNKTGIISNIEVREVIPLTLSRDLDKINFEPKYDEVVKKDPPFVVLWKFTFSGKENTEKDIIYTTIVNQEIDNVWLENWMTPYVEVETINPEANPAIAFFTSLTGGYIKVLTGLIPNYYLAVAIYLSTFLCLLFIIYESLTVFAAFISSMLSRNKFDREVYKFIGHGRKGGLAWVIVGIALIVVGTILLVSFKEIDGSDKMEMVPRIAANPLMAIGILIIIIGITSLYTVVMDLIKGIIFGEKYFFEPVDMAKSKIDEIRGLMGMLQERIEDCCDFGISTETELLFLGTQRKKIDEIEKSLDIENADEYLLYISRIFLDIVAEIKEVEEKKDLYKNWPLWNESIDKILITKDTVTPEDLVLVPEEWRKWTLTKYLSEHLGETLTIENGVLIRMRIATVRKGEVDLLLNEFLGAERLEGVALVRRDGLVIASNLPRAIDANVIAAISAKVMANADMSSMELEKGKTKLAIIKSTGGETIIYCGKKIILIALVRPGEATGFIISGIEKVMEKIEPLF